MARIVRLHLRYPQGWTRAPEFVEKLQQVFDVFQADVSFIVASSAGVAGGRLTSVNADPCTTAPTAEVAALFRDLAPAGMADDEIAVLFAAGLSGSVRWGCAQCPQGRRGVLVSCLAPPIALAHEVAHLYLGPGHDADSSNLMFADSAALSMDPPILLATQIAALQGGTWVLPPPGGGLVFTAAPPPKTRARRKRPAPAKKTRRKKTKKKTAVRRNRTATKKQKPRHGTTKTRRLKRRRAAKARPKRARKRR